MKEQADRTFNSISKIHLSIQDERLRNLMKKDDVCGQCGGQLSRDEHPDGIAVGKWECTECDWFQDDIINTRIQEELLW